MALCWPACLFKNGDSKGGILSIDGFFFLTDEENRISLFLSLHIEALITMPTSPLSFMFKRNATIEQGSSSSNNNKPYSGVMPIRNSLPYVPAVHHRHQEREREARVCCTLLLLLPFITAGPSVLMMFNGTIACASLTFCRAFFFFHFFSYLSKMASRWPSAPTFLSGDKLESDLFLDRWGWLSSLSLFPLQQKKTREREDEQDTSPHLTVKK